MHAHACASVHVEAVEGEDEVQGSRTGPWQPDRRKGGLALAQPRACSGQIITCLKLDLTLSNSV